MLGKYGKSCYLFQTFLLWTIQLYISAASRCFVKMKRQRKPKKIHSLTFLQQEYLVECYECCNFAALNVKKYGNR